MKRTLYLLALPLLFLLSGCASKYYEKPQPALIVLKSDLLKYADMGFVYRAKSRIKVEIYSAGQPAFTLTVGKRICIDSGCMSESEFYSKYLKAPYPPGTLQAILSKRPIFGGMGLGEEGGKMIQRIEETGKFDIIYTFDSTSARFRDRLNNILIKITER